VERGLRISNAKSGKINGQILTMGEKRGLRKSLENVGKRRKKDTSLCRGGRAEVRA